MKNVPDIGKAIARILYLASLAKEFDDRRAKLDHLRKIQTTIEDFLINEEYRR